MKSYVKFELVEIKPKTEIYAVRSRSSGDGLGWIKWYGPWRQYCFFPHSDTVWSRGCLKEIMEFLNKLMEARKK